MVIRHPGIEPRTKTQRLMRGGHCGGTQYPQQMVVVTNVSHRSISRGPPWATIFNKINSVRVVQGREKIYPTHGFLCHSTFSTGAMQPPCASSSYRKPPAVYATTAPASRKAKF